MRSQSFLNKCHSFIRTGHDFHGPSLLKVRGTCSPRRTRLRPLVLSSTVIRPQSTSSTPSLEPDANSTTVHTPDPVIEGNESPAKPDSPHEEAEKVPVKIRRIRTSPSSAGLKPSSASPKDTNPFEFPEGLNRDIIFVPTESILESSPPPSFPPAEIYEEALHKLLITLHPQNQARAISPPSSRPIEPTLGLICPIEGGDNIIDSTIHELAFHTGSEVLILDAVQLAAGEWGTFGKAANALNLNPNPLHFPSAIRMQPHESGRRRSMPDEYQDEGQGPVILTAPSRMSITIPKTLSTSAGRMAVPPSTRKPSPPSRLDLFFETLINLPCPEDQASTTRIRPRLIYIRDFPTLAPSSSSWYPSLLNAVRQRRRGLLARSSNAMASPVTIIFGMSPPIANPLIETPPKPTSSLFDLMSQSLMPSHAPQGSKPEFMDDLSESDNAQAAREKRLRARLRKWAKNPAALQAEFPKLRTTAEGREGFPLPGIILIGGPNGSSSIDPAGMALDVSSTRSEEGRDGQFFRSAVLVPRTRSLSDERESRMSRRRQINELTMRMGIGAIGGFVDPSPAFPETSEQDVSTTPISSTSPMWEGWSNRLESWSNVRKISDMAVGNVIFRHHAMNSEEKPFLVPTLVPWLMVQLAWLDCNQFVSKRARWLEEAFGDKLSETRDAAEDDVLRGPGSTSDKTVENLKNDPELDPHEARLLPCIVDANSLTTTFNHVHLPSQTIDAVRTIVSLPLLHPHAFQQGILKEHSMTGCLLFGPPGTGKTLVVRALAKEAGCRMLVVSPSDVMDMYVGEGEKLVRAVFSLARKLSPCVVFLDEIDALFGARMSARDSGSAFAHRGVITEFMQEMDGLKSSKEHNVIVIGATNRPFDLDDAVLRRLPRRLLVDLPGEKEREEILKILLRDETLAADVNVNSLAKKTDGFSGSDLKHLCVSAALDSVKENVVLPWVSRHPQSTTPSQPSQVTTAAIEEETEGKDDDATRNSPANSPSKSSAKASGSSEPTSPPRTLHLQHFTQALTEITPSSSETLGTLSDLRKWNEEFGEGRRDRRRRQVWGKGQFGFVDGLEPIVEEGRVAK